MESHKELSLIQDLHVRIRTALDDYRELEGQSDPSVLTTLLEEADTLLGKELNAGARQKMLSARTALKELAQSRYLPFSSPSPCSNEANIKRAVRRAIENIDAAIAFHENQFGKS